METSANALFGTVVSGRGRATAAQAVVEPDVARLLGAKPAPGTLNLILDRPVELPVDVADLSAGGYHFFRCTFLGKPSLVMRFPGCPRHVAEIVSTTNFRSEHGARDGEIHPLDLPAAKSPSAGKYALWTLFWAGRRDLYYTAYAQVLNRYARSLTRI